MSRTPNLTPPISQACTSSQLNSPEADYWFSRIGLSSRRHRKDWEWLYISQALAWNGMLAPGRRGLGFGVGTEPLTDLFTSFGCHILATDLDFESAKAAGWADTNQHASQSSQLYRGYSSEADFGARVSYRVVDMNNIPADLQDFDFTWSSCCLEHLGSLDHGLHFIENSLKTLRPGGIAVHTTEFNCSSNDDTLSTGWCVVYRKQDIERLAKHLQKLNFHIDLNFNLGDQPDDQFVDMPPYKHDPHLKMQLEKYAITSFGLIIRKPL